MPTDFKPGCVRPKSSLAVSEVIPVAEINKSKEVVPMIRVGAPAPDFEMAAYFKGGFKNFRLSEFKGKWVVLCFYPGDFTFV